MTDRIETFADYEILIVPGRNNRLTLSLSGVGNLATGVMGFEWRRTFEEIDTGDHILYIKDMTRSWFNTRKGFAELIAFLTRYIAQHGITETTAIGLSMGAYGSFVMANYLPLTRAVAINPRSSLDASGAFDPRSPDLIAAIGQGPHMRLAEQMHDKTDYLLIFTLDNAQDLQHAQRLIAQAPRLSVLSYHGPHNIGEAYRKHGQLRRFLSAAISGDRPALRQLHLMPITLPEVEQLLASYANADPLEAHAATPPHFVPPECDAAYRDMRLTQAIAQGEPAEFHPILRAGKPVQTAQMMPYLLTGWSHLEPTGLWSLGRAHSLCFSMIEHKVIGQAHLAINGHAFTPTEAVGQRLRIKVNGKDVFETTFTQQKPHFDLRIPLPQAQQIAIHFETPDATSVAKVTGDPQKDQRALAIWLDQIELVAEYL